MSHLIDLGTQCSPLSHTNMEALKQLIISNPGGISREQNNCIVGNTDFPWILRTCRQKEGKKYFFFFCKKKKIMIDLLPGHVLLPQIIESVEDPLQNLPPLLGTGALHSLVLVTFAPPHITGHLVHPVHIPQPP